MEPNEEGGGANAVSNEREDLFSLRSKNGALLLELLASFPQHHPHFCPETTLRDRIRSIFSNLKLSNITRKVAEMDQLKKKLDLIPFLAQQFLIFYCDSSELQSQQRVLQQRFLDMMQCPQLSRHVLQNAVHVCKCLMQRESIAASSSERSLLKNLGTWIGVLTLGKNKPLLFKDLDLKEVMFSACEDGRMIAAIPFVSKILEACRSSKVFVLPNPWLSGLVSLLTELHGMDNIVLNIRFEIEMLFKTLSIDINSQLPSKEFHRLREDKMCSITNPDWNQNQLDSPTASESYSSATTPLQSSLDGGQSSLIISDLHLTLTELWSEHKDAQVLVEELYEAQRSLRKILSRIRKFRSLQEERQLGIHGRRQFNGNLDKALAKALAERVEVNHFVASDLVFFLFGTASISLFDKEIF